MTIEQIKAAIEAGKTVCWKADNYIVSKDTIGQYLITCTNNNHAIGLTWKDGITLNGEESDFFILSDRVTEEQIYTAIGMAEGRLSTGADLTDAFNWLKEDIAKILSGETIYE